MSKCCWNCGNPELYEKGDKFMNFVAQLDTAVCKTNMQYNRKFDFYDGIICDPHTEGDCCESWVARCTD